MIFNLFRNKEKELERAKDKLIADLEKNGIPFLLTGMSSNEFYSPLIKEKRKRGSYSSDDTINWYAFKRSSLLNSPKDKKELLELLDTCNTLDQKNNIYCCLSSICSNTNDVELFELLMKIIEFENNEKITVSILSRLREMKKVANLDIKPIKKALLEGSEPVRHAAIRALCNTIDPQVEELLLTEFKTGNGDIQGSICVPLAGFGTIKSIPILQESLKRTRSGSLKHAIEHAIKEIKNRHNAH